MGNYEQDIDSMYEDYLDNLLQEHLDEQWRNDPHRQELDAAQAWRERFDKSLRGQIFYWRRVEEVSWWKTVCYILRGDKQ